MKNLKKLIALTIIAFVSINLTSCDDDDDNDMMKTNNIVDFVLDNQENYSVLAAALTKADLIETLKTEGPFTVFAPDNDAFGAFLADAGFSSLEAVPTPILKQILLNHVVSGAVKSTDLSTGYVNTLSMATPNEKYMSMFVNTNGGVMLNGVSDVVGADYMVDNGVVHLVDAVIGLPTVVTFATADPNFTNLVAALTRDDQPDFVATLSTSNGTSPAPFTVFAPTNAAFGSLLTELNATSLSQIAGATLTATLNHHVVAGANVVAGDLTNNMTVGTLGGNITANVTGGAKLTDMNNRVSNITAYDVQATNGVVHVIDKVILPPLN